MASIASSVMATETNRDICCRGCERCERHNHIRRPDGGRINHDAYMLISVQPQSRRQNIGTQVFSTERAAAMLKRPKPSFQSGF